jgi:hypothetical protein
VVALQTTFFAPDLNDVDAATEVLETVDKPN